MAKQAPEEGLTEHSTEDICLHQCPSKIDLFKHVAAGMHRGRCCDKNPKIFCERAVFTSQYRYSSSITDLSAEVLISFSR